VYIARIAILNTAINLSISRRHYNSCVLSNAKKIGSVVDLGALAICESVFFWPPRGSHKPFVIALCNRALRATEA
jgi:hypothetical protein